MKQNQKTEEAKQKQRTAQCRAGNRKCQRCKKIFYREKGIYSKLCLDCTNHCPRCNILLTEENICKSFIKLKQRRCKNCVSEITKKTTNKERARDTRLISRFGITAKEYDEILHTQNGNCWICDKPPRKVRLHVDHKHMPGDTRNKGRFDIRERVRGLLCWRCNSGLVKYLDNPILFRKAAEYLETLPAQKILKRK